MSDLIENYFKLERPDQYLCEVQRYGIGHSQMAVYAYPPADIGQALAIGFSDVKYFECPIFWRGANFFRKDPTEYFEFLVKLGYEEESQRLQWAGYYLFEAPMFPHREPAKEELTAHRVRILAGSAGIVEI